MEAMKTIAFFATITLLGVLPVGCAGKAVQTSYATASDGGPSDGPVTQPEAGPDAPADALPDAIADANDAETSTAFECVCRNWKDDRYPASFLNRFANSTPCVLDGCPAGKVCCATPCVSPDVCRYESGKMYQDYQGCQWIDNTHEYLPKEDCCWDYGFTACVFPEQCAPGGVLHHQEYDPDKNNFGVCKP